MGTISIDTPKRQRETEFRIFGPATLIRDGHAVELPSGGPRELLALLLLSPERTVSEDLFVSVMGGKNTLGGADAVHNLAALRTVLEGTGIDITRYTMPRGEASIAGPARNDVPGFALVGPAEVDLDRCAEFIRSALTTRDREFADQLLRSAVAASDGDPLVGLAGSYFDDQRALLNKARGILRVVTMRKPSQPASVIWSQYAFSLGPNPFVDYWSGRSDGGRRFTEIGERNPGSQDAAPEEREWTPRRSSHLSSLIPVSIYLGQGDAAVATQAALQQLLDEIGVETVDQGPAIHGSWFRKLLARIRREAAHLSAEQVAAELERKFRIEVFDKAQASIDSQQATGAAALIASLQGEERACIRVGSLLVLKVNGHIMVNNLTQYQLAWLERNQALLRDPEGLLQGLETLPAQSTLTELPPSASSH